MSATGVATTLAARGRHYEGPGGFPDTATTSQNLKAEFRYAPNWRLLSDAQKEALEMIAGKISRILNGNRDHVDSWHDIQGYASLGEKDVLDRQEALNKSQGVPK